MNFSLALMSAALPGIGVLEALAERDILPKNIYAAADGVLTAGLFACGHSAAELERLACALYRNRLALLNQILPALTDFGTRLSPGDIAARVFCTPPYSSNIQQTGVRDDAITTLLSELTGHVSLNGIKTRLTFATRAYYHDQPKYASSICQGRSNSSGYELRTISSGADSRFAISLAEAMRGAAFPPGIFQSPLIGGHAITACSLSEAVDMLCSPVKCKNAPDASSFVRAMIFAAPADAPSPPGCLRIVLPQFAYVAAPQRQIRAGYEAARRCMSEILCLAQP